MMQELVQADVELLSKQVKNTAKASGGQGCKSEKQI